MRHSPPRCATRRYRRAWSCCGTAIPLQNAEPENRIGLEEWLTLVERRCVDRLGCFHRGLAETLRALGWPSYSVRNFIDVSTPPSGDGPPDDGRLHVGIWSAGPSWRKNPHAAIAALALLDKVVLHGVLSSDALAWARRLGVELGEVETRALPRAELHARMSRVQINLSVSLAECSPLLPLESLSLGVPCLIGPSGCPFDASLPEGSALREGLLVAIAGSPARDRGNPRAGCVPAR